jgi:hypothetical protein
MGASGDHTTELFIDGKQVDAVPIQQVRALATLAAIIALVLLVPPAAAARGTAAVGSPTALSPQGATTVGFWAGEAVPGTDWHNPSTYWDRRDTHDYTPYLWRVLRRYQIPLYFNLRYGRDFGPVPPGEPQRHDALRIIRTANRLGVPVWGWILVPYSDGYWAWEGNAAEQFAAVRALTHWTRTKHVRLRGYALDPEPRVLTPFETTAAIVGGGNDALFSTLFPETIDPASQCAAWHEYARIPRWAERHHIRVATAPAPAALDDIGDGRLALQDASGFIVPNAPWSELFFQAYRSVFSYYSGHDPGPSIVSSYFRSAQSEFGDAGQISLGSAGRGPYRRFSHLVDDVRLAATLGARNLPIYSLERTLRAYGGPRAVIRLVNAARNPFTSRATKSAVPSPRAKALRAAIRHADKAARAATPAITAAHNAPLPANRWPGGCGA